MELVLASQSFDRKQLFKRAGIPITVIPSGFDEGSVLNGDPIQLIREIAREKGKIVKKIWNQDYAATQGPALIISADTMGLIGDNLIGKPTSIEDAFQMIRLLSGKIHSVYTALHIMASSDAHEENYLSHSKVTFQHLTDDEIRKYISHSNEIFTRAAAYSIINTASLFISNIEGSFSNIIGLPMAQLRILLKKFGVELLTYVKLS